jgi:hypothetical protein
VPQEKKTDSLSNKQLTSDEFGTSKRSNDNVKRDMLIPDQGRRSESRPTSGRRANRGGGGAGLFDNDDDILSGLDEAAPAQRKRPGSAAKSNLMSDLFGSSNDKSEVGGAKKNEFVLDPKYKAGATTATSALKADNIDLSKSTSFLPTKPDPTPAPVEPRPRRRGGGGPTLEPKKQSDILDDEKLFQGTSLAAGSNPAPVTQPPVATATAAAPSWLQGQTALAVPTISTPSNQQSPSTSGPSWLHGQASANIPSVPSTSTNQVASPSIATQNLSPELQNIAASHQKQMQEMAEIERKQLEQFQNDLNEQKMLLEKKQLEHKAALEQQRLLRQDQMREIQERQNAILKQQQAQSEAMIAQIRSQMESELKVRNELMRNQLSMLSDIQLQNPDKIINLEQFLQGGVGKSKR